MSGPRVTTVVITRDRLPDLACSLPQHQPPVVLVDNGSTDDTVRWVTDNLPWIEVIALGDNLGASARNIGVEAARTPYVAFADDDSWWHPGALDLAADVFDGHPRLAVLAARILVGPEERLDPIDEVMAASPLGRAPDAGPGGSYAFLQTQQDGEEPVAYDPCRPLQIVVNEARNRRKSAGRRGNLALRAAAQHRIESEPSPEVAMLAG